MLPLLRYIYGRCGTAHTHTHLRSILPYFFCSWCATTTQEVCHVVGSRPVACTTTAPTTIVETNGRAHVPLNSSNKSAHLCSSDVNVCAHVCVWREWKTDEPAGWQSERKSGIWWTHVILPFSIWRILLTQFNLKEGKHMYAARINQSRIMFDCWLIQYISHVTL